MGFSYSGDPSRNQKDEVRYLIGDTDNCDPLLQDAEIDYLIKIYACSNTAAAQGARGIAAKFSRFANEKVGQVSVNFKERAENYLTLARELDKKAAIDGADWFAGGISKSNKETTERDSDRVVPDFNKDLHENDRKGSLRPLGSESDFD